MLFKTEWYLSLSQPLSSKIISYSPNGDIGFLVCLRNKVGFPQIGQPARYLRSNLDRDSDIPSCGWYVDRNGPRHGRKDFSSNNPAVNGKTSNLFPMPNAPRANLERPFGGIRSTPSFPVMDARKQIASVMHFKRCPHGRITFKRTQR